MNKILQISLFAVATLSIQNGMYGSEEERKANAALVHVVTDREYEHVEELLKNGVSPNISIDCDGMSTPLIVSVIRNSIYSSADQKMLKLLLAHKATVNYYMGAREPFVMAAENSVVFELLSKHTKTIPFPENILCRIVHPDASPSIGLQEGIASAALTMERPEFDDGVRIEAAYTYIKEEQQKAVKYPWSSFGDKMYVERAINILNGARMRVYQQRIPLLASKILEINAEDKPQVILKPVAKIIAEYGAGYPCEDTRPLMSMTGS